MRKERQIHNAVQARVATGALPGDCMIRAIAAEYELQPSRSAVVHGIRAAHITWCATMALRSAPPSVRRPLAIFRGPRVV